MENIPVYMQKTARRILQAQQEHKESVGQVVWAKGIKELMAGEPITIKDLRITPLASDHSACDVSGHITKEDLKDVIDVVEPDKLLVHHTSSDKKSNSFIEVPEQVRHIYMKDGEIVNI